MRLALATINFHDVLCRNARQSFEAAARRWGAEFIELTEENTPSDIPCQICKTIIFDVAPWADRVFYVDGSDAIIRGDAPSPFDVCPPDKLGAVEDGEPALPSWSRTLCRQKASWQSINRRLGQVTPFPDFYFSAGVLILTRDAHERMLKRVLEISRQVGRSSAWWIDQPFFNYAVTELAVPVLKMDATWNLRQPIDARVPLWMDGYVYHYAAVGQRYSIIPILNWRAPGPPAGTARPAKLSRMTRVFQFLRSIPVLGPNLPYLYVWFSLPVRYLSAWFTLPVRIKRLSDQVTEVNHMLKGLYLRQGERAPGEKPRPPDPRP